MDERARVKALLRENPTLPYEEFYGILDAYQVATGHRHGVEGIRALLDWLAEGRPFYILPRKAQGSARAVRSHEELARVIAAYDSAIDLPNDEELGADYRRGAGLPPRQG